MLLAFAAQNGCAVQTNLSVMGREACAQKRVRAFKFNTTHRLWRCTPHVILKMACKLSRPLLLALLGTTTVEVASVAFLVFARRHARQTAFFAMAGLERAPNSQHVSSQTAHSQTRLVVHAETPSAPMNRQVCFVLM
jgi:hypothetical protein